MTGHSPRLFASDAAIDRVGNGVLDRSLPKAEWTHEAHLAACVWLILNRPDITPEAELPGIIRAYNTATGVINDDTQGYHETLTQLYIIGVRRFLAGRTGGSLHANVNALLAGDTGRREWPLRFYSRQLLFSAAARLGWTEPELSAI